MSARPLRLNREGALRYFVRVPADDAPAPHPVLMFLHGYDEGAPMDIHDALTLHGPLRAGNPDSALEQFIIVAPQMPVRGDVWFRTLMMCARYSRACSNSTLAMHGARI